MTCAPYINPPAAVVAVDEPIAQAVRLLAANNFAPLPVVDAERRLAGTFGPQQLATLLLPMGARLAGDSFDLGFVSEAPRDLQERLAGAAGDRVGEHAAAVQPLRADSSLDEALLRMHRGEDCLFIVDDTGHLTGVMTAASVLAPLVKGV
ncbi:MAG: HPP family protein [Bacteroidales bacterium]